ncbi:hypothetical protein [Thalassotalea mangrovi]|uniref:DUF943 family protein n=1 Tax=Thalassotalea mangrovi TaxID=2572245 RepID=A0A4U1B8P1_9GAMM|nr:hypothetical protein [Thalassotalea mangrovi]TKB47059.1 hypothetical protein E8M12_02025 [Thalassotalea mangrovi]
MKKTIIKVMFPALTLFVATASAANNSYLCQVEHSAGFQYQQETKSWSSNATHEVIEAYKIQPNSRGSNIEEYPYEWVRVTDDSFLGFCRDFNLDARMHCKGIGKLEFHKDSKRFLFVSDKGYVAYNSPRPIHYKADSTSPEPMMEIGRCERMEE